MLLSTLLVGLVAIALTTLGLAAASVITLAQALFIGVSLTVVFILVAFARPPD